MRVICYECKKQIGEKAPFSDHQATHTLCNPCLREVLEKLRDERRRQKEKLLPHRPDVASGFDA